MKITFISLMMAVLWSSVMAAFLYWMRKKSAFAKGFGIVSVVILYLFCIVRLVLPIDFAFTRGIQVRGLFADIYSVICHRKMQIGAFSLSLSDCGVIVWGMGAVILLLRFLFEYRHMCKRVECFEKREDKQCIETLKKISENTGKKKKVTVYKNKGLTIPMGMGIWKKRIFLPDREYTDRELYYILLHEYTHFINKDLTVKILVHIYCCIFWWNPVGYFLKKDLSRSLEIKCDLCVTENMTKSEISEYLSVIVKTLKASGSQKEYPSIQGTVSLAGKAENEMVERFQIVAENQDSPQEKKRVTAAWVGMFVLIMLISYTFVPQPAYDPPEEEIITESGVYEFTPENSYVEKKDSKYYWTRDNVASHEISEDTACELQKEGFEIRRSEK